MVSQPKRVGVSESIRLRMEPRQARSSHRIVELLDGAASHIHQHGFETMTTQAVALASGNSIGTLYRFFEDRIDLLQALTIRNVERAKANLGAAIDKHPPQSLDALAGVLFKVFLAMFKSEPGFKSIRLGDVLDIRPAPESRWGNRSFAQTAIELYQEHSGHTLTAEQRTDIELAVDLADTLLHKAFLQSARGDKATIDRARQACQLAASGALRG